MSNIFSYALIHAAVCLSANSRSCTTCPPPVSLSRALDHVTKVQPLKQNVSSGPKHMPHESPAPQAEVRTFQKSRCLRLFRSTKNGRREPHQHANCRRRASMLETTVEPPRAVRPTPAPPHSSKPAMQRKSPADPRHARRAMHVSLIPSVGLVSCRCPPRFVRPTFCILQISTLAAPTQPPTD